jgi:sugar phosphate permease
MRAVASEGHLWPLALGLLPYVGTRFGFQSLWGGPYFADIYHLSAEEIGTLMMIMSLSVVLFSPVAGFLSDRVFASRKWFAVGGLILNTLCWLPLTFAAGGIPVLAFYPLVIALGALSCMWIPVYAQAKELHSAAVAGTVLAVLQFATSFGGAVYQQLLGVVIGFYPKAPTGYPLEAYSAAFAVCLASCAFATVLIATSKEVRGKTQP